MQRITKTSAILLTPVIALTLAAAPDDGDEVELDEAEVFIEYNSTDGDFGIQFFWDGEPWKKMNVLRPDEKAILRVRASKNLALQGLTEGFFESAEPSVDELSMDEFLERFPEGEYEFEGRTLEGDELEGETDFTHTLPAPPENLYPAEDDSIDSTQPLDLSLNPVTTDLNGDPLDPELYEVILEHEGELLRVFSIILEGDFGRPMVTVPPQFLHPDQEYKLEVIVQEESGNKTISETTFTTY